MPRRKKHVRTELSGAYWLVIAFILEFKDILSKGSVTNGFIFQLLLATSCFFNLRRPRNTIKVTHLKLPKRKGGPAPTGCVSGALLRRAASRASSERPTRPTARTLVYLFVLTATGFHFTYGLTNGTRVFL
uniref:Uncharacterized protein n=1 Tax=Caulerpa lentillifera TaxID=148947 RepID=A0A2Z2QLG3_9CHLO|nr:hypothetical protein [Caulerpa lentillifera]AST24235.1 hypothetical protein [Caulerpa lentillifera]